MHLDTNPHGHPPTNEEVYGAYDSEEEATGEQDCSGEIVNVKLK